MTNDTPELRELKKQTRIMAERQAGGAGALVFLIALGVLTYLGVGGWWLWGGAVAAGLFGGQAAVKGYTAD